jgi:hypothetical protein
MLGIVHESGKWRPCLVENRAGLYLNTSSVGLTDVVRSSEHDVKALFHFANLREHYGHLFVPQDEESGVRASQISRYRVTHHPLLSHRFLVTDLIQISRDNTLIGAPVRLRLMSGNCIRADQLACSLRATEQVLLTFADSEQKKC